MSRVFVITGPSGVGKGTLIRELCARIPGLELSISATTRAPRVGEEDGVDYHFLDRAEFDRRVEAGDFLEWAEYSGNRYGTLRSEVERRTERGAPVVLEIEVQGARQVRETMPEAVRIFIEPPSADRSCASASSAAGTDDPDVIERRLEEAREGAARKGRVLPPRDQRRARPRGQRAGRNRALGARPVAVAAPNP